LTTFRSPAGKLQTGALYLLNQIIEQVSRSCVPALLCFFLIAGVFFGLFPVKAFSVPVFKDGAKYGLASAQNQHRLFVQYPLSAPIPNIGRI
jgi:hypothetical protein